MVQKLAIEFSIDILNIYKRLISKKEYILSKQLLRSGTSIGANIYEAQEAESIKDFIHKMSISLKESNEVKYWLILLKDTDFIDSKDYCKLFDKVCSIHKILTAIVKTSKRKIV
jgi:four helix bundle protein